MEQSEQLNARASRFNIWLGQKGILRDRHNFSNKSLRGWADDFLKLMNLDMSPEELVTALRSIWGKKGAETRRKNKSPTVLRRQREREAREDMKERQGELF